MTSFTREEISFGVRLIHSASPHLAFLDEELVADLLTTLSNWPTETEDKHATAGVQFVPEPHIDLGLGTKIDDFDDLLAAISLASHETSTKVEELRKLLWPIRSDSAQRAWLRRRERLSSMLRGR